MELSPVVILSGDTAELVCGMVEELPRIDTGGNGAAALADATDAEVEEDEGSVADAAEEYSTDEGTGVFELSASARSSAAAISLMVFCTASLASSIGNNDVVMRGDFREVDDTGRYAAAAERSALLRGTSPRIIDATASKHTIFTRANRVLMFSNNLIAAALLLITARIAQVIAVSLPSFDARVIVVVTLLIEDFNARF